MYIMFAYLGYFFMNGIRVIVLALYDQKKNENVHKERRMTKRSRIRVRAI